MSSITCMSIFATRTTKKKGGGVPTVMILYIKNQVYSACVIQCTKGIFHHYYKSEKMKHFSYQTHTLYFFHIYFTLRMIILIYGEYIVHLHFHIVIGKDRWFIQRNYIYVYDIAYFPFHSVFHSFPFSVAFSIPRFSNTP